MENWPNLFIIGAPKAGTSSLYAYLSKINGIYMSVIKEPNYFSIATFSDNGTQKVIRDKEKYLSLFKKGKNEKIIGEASPEYLSDIEAPKLIHKVSPDAKIIISIRDPVERAFSFYLMHIRLGKIESTFISVLKESLEKKHKGLKSPKGLLETGLYYEGINKYLKLFGPNQVKIIIFEEFIKNPKKTMYEILAFLNCDDSINDFDGKIYNRFGVPRGKISQLVLKNKMLARVAERIISPSRRKLLKENLLIKNISKPKINFEERKILIDFYKEDVKKMEKLLGKKLPWKNFQE